MQLKDFVYWIDANLPPKTVTWLSEAFNVTAKHMYDMGLLTSDDNTIFQKAKSESEQVIIITKDEDFVELVLRRKPPPKIIWITAGNLSNIHLQEILLKHLSEAVEKLTNPDNYFIEIR
jgi:predicted nuclease of predicted toxin-antitoxin system